MRADAGRTGQEARANVVGQWKRLAIENMGTAFGGGVAETVRDRGAEFEKLHAKIKIGQFVVERDFLQKAFGR